MTTRNAATTDSLVYNIIDLVNHTNIHTEYLLGDSTAKTVLSGMNYNIRILMKQNKNVSEDDCIKLVVRGWINHYYFRSDKTIVIKAYGKYFKTINLSDSHDFYIDVEEITSDEAYKIKK